MNNLSVALEFRIQQQLLMIEERLAQEMHKAKFPTSDDSSKCGTCNKTFTERENLKIHQKSHRANKQFKCNVCEKSFEHSGKLHRHMRIHTGERPHECNICGKSFIQSGQLVIHMRSHTGDRPYACTSCEKTFTCSKQLKVHMRTHTKEKPYKCDVCGKSFGYNHVLKLHQVAHFGEKVYKCTLCESTFDKKKHLEWHIRHHNEPLILPSIETLTPRDTPSPQPAHGVKKDSCQDSHIILPSINTIIPDEKIDQYQMELEQQPEDLSLKSKTAHSRISPIRRNPIFPVTPSLVKTLLSEDLAQFGAPSPIPTPPLSPAIYGDCLVSRHSPGVAPLSLTPPPSVSPPQSPQSISTMSESSLPLRKRRHALSDCSDSEDFRPSPANSPCSGRSSVICFATK